MAVPLGEDQTLIVNILDKKEIQVLTDTYMVEALPTKATNAFDAVSVRCGRSDGVGLLPIMSMIDNGHLEALYGGQEGPEEAVLV